MSTVQKPPPDWELVLKRNPVERIKREKAPLGIRDELPALIAAGYEAVAEEDMVRLQWWGLYHDKPKIGTFMLRVKVPAGQLSPTELRVIGEVSNRYGRGDGELDPPEHPAPLARAREAARRLRRPRGLGRHDRRRLRRHRPQHHRLPVQGIAADELFDATPIVDAAADLFYGNPDWANLPRKHKYSISACADRCNAPEINCISLIGTVHEGREGFAVHVGGGLSSVPRIARDMGVFIPKEDANEILGAITSVWSEDLSTASRASRRGSSSWSTTSARRGSASASRPASAGSSRTTRCRRSRSSRRTTSASTPSARRGSTTSACRCISGSSRATR